MSERQRPDGVSEHSLKNAEKRWVEVNLVRELESGEIEKLSGVLLVAVVSDQLVPYRFEQDGTIQVGAHYITHEEFLACRQ